MYASSAEDAEEWIELLREKMSKVSSEEMWRWECVKGAGGECVSVSVSVCVLALKVACSPVFSRSTNLEFKLIEFFVFVNF